MIFWNGWNEDCWNEESRARQGIWNAEWKLVQEIFGERCTEIVASPEIPETEGARESFIATFPAHHIPAPKATGGKE